HFEENSGDRRKAENTRTESEVVKEILEKQLAMKQTDQHGRTKDVKKAENEPTESQMFEAILEQTHHHGRTKDVKKAKTELSKMFHGMMREWA
ncbi:hypothetical protein, partial [Salmonella sp. s54925]|uniref:hypothetical protein n=1 Tax=Salmonella sp. s54925 TaxID=3159674 RepID=UPI00397FD635